SLPHEVEQIVADVVRYFGTDVRIGVHTHDDTGCGVANALAGVRGGATHVQGTVNGYGERTGNCNLTTVIANLALKMGVRTIPADRMERLTPVSHHVAELVNMPLNPQQPYVGTSAFAHKAGLHVSAIVRRPDAYEHVPPDTEGNGTVNALDRALRLAIGSRYPVLERIHLTDYKVRVLDTAKGTGAITRVLIDSTDGERSWSTIGVSDNIIEASWQALCDSIVF